MVSLRAAHVFTLASSLKTIKVHNIYLDKKTTKNTPFPPLKTLRWHPSKKERTDGYDRRVPPCHYKLPFFLRQHHCPLQVFNCLLTEGGGEPVALVEVIVSRFHPQA